MHDLVILAGGIGSRLKKININKLPKPLLKVKNKTFLDYLISNISKFSFNKIFILAGYKGYLIKKKFHNKIKNFEKIQVIKEKFPMGTGGALNAIKHKITKNFFLINGDTIFDININELSKIKMNNIVGIMALSNSLSYKNNTKLTKLNIRSNKAIFFDSNSKFFNGGTYFFNKRIFKYIPKKKSSLENDILPNLIKKKFIKGIKFNNFFIDIGTPKNYFYAQKIIPKYFLRPAAFLDRDGVINYDYNYVYKIKDFKFRPRVINSLSYLNKKKFYSFIVTNQAGIAKGMFSKNDFIKLHKKIKKILLKKNIFLHDVKFCPFHEDGIIKKYKKKSLYRKPGNLMIRSIQRDWLIDFKKSFMIGDQKIDEICAKKSNLYFEYVKKNTYQQIKNLTNKFI